MDTMLLCCLSECFQTLLSVGLSQPKGAAALVDFKAHPAVVNLGDPAELRVLRRITSQPLLQLCVVCGDLHRGICFVEVDLCKFLFFPQNAFLPKKYCFFVAPAQVKTRK